ncbi:hypothetical protein TNIN_105331 [Trichonephila inaurata madagascariensis]|uniref:Uncharacterized protein n=1 Tax=Trichonephila inaurata madagascariensis TaxID=2747483 RepID=A0A8X7C1W6_9ARAC|nr:hypothetical protein TNIN_105331 [Trichonephila inaurata madagascariensis]
MDLTQIGIINNVHIPSSYSRFVITDAFIYDNQQITAKEGWTGFNVPALTFIECSGRPHQESGRATHPLTLVDSTAKETVPSDTTLNSPNKRTLKKNLRLKTDKKRLIDDDGFQTPDKRHTAKKISKKNPSLSPRLLTPLKPLPHLLNRGF